MPLKAEAALRKDRTNAASTLERRHFATIAAIISRATFHGFNREEQRRMADQFAHELQHTNPRFDRARFLAACKGD